MGRNLMMAFRMRCHVVLIVACILVCGMTQDAAADPENSAVQDAHAGSSEFLQLGTTAVKKFAKGANRLKKAMKKKKQKPKKLKTLATSGIKPKAPGGTFPTERLKKKAAKDRKRVLGSEESEG